MRPLALYFQVHQPYRLGRYTCFNVGQHSSYFDDALNKDLLRRVVHKSYLPSVAMFHSLIERYGSEFSLALSFSGTLIEQCEEWAPEAIEAFKGLVETGSVEIFGETYHHSLASLLDEDWFKFELESHRSKIRELFGIVPSVARNTELIYSNEIGTALQQMGYRGAIIEEPPFPHRADGVFKHPGGNLALFARDRELSDEIAFRFTVHPAGVSLSQKVDRFIALVTNRAMEGDRAHPLGIFIDLETFGEHHWEDTGIFSFFDQVVTRLIQEHEVSFVTPSQMLTKTIVAPECSIDTPYSWADKDKGISAWLGNTMQQSFARQLLELSNTGNRESCCNVHSQALGRLSTSDHFYYMSTKEGGDGVVHSYFSPFESPYDAFARVMNVLRDIRLYRGDTARSQRCSRSMHQATNAVHPV